MADLLIKDIKPHESRELRALIEFQNARTNLEAVLNGEEPPKLPHVFHPLPTFDDIVKQHRAGEGSMFDDLMGRPTQFRRLFSRSSWGRRVRQRGARSTGNDKVDRHYHERATAKRERKAARGPGFAKPSAPGWWK